MIELIIEGHVAHVVLNHPSRLNAMGPWFWDGMAAIFDQVNANPDVRVVVLRAEGSAFSAGLDLVEMMPRLPLGASSSGFSRRWRAGRLTLRSPCD